MKCSPVYVSYEPKEQTIPYVGQWIGENNILYASDYPHWDCNFLESVSTLINRSDVSDVLKRKISFENPQRYYALKDR
jgi:predicted TIM-barrel fold metal-dependent hydrolase